MGIHRMMITTPTYFYRYAAYAHGVSAHEYGTVQAESKPLEAVLQLAKDKYPHLTIDVTALGRL